MKREPSRAELAAAAAVVYMREVVEWKGASWQRQRTTSLDDDDDGRLSRVIDDGGELEEETSCDCHLRAR